MEDQVENLSVDDGSSAIPASLTSAEVLRNAPARWLRVLSRGAWVMVAGAVIYIVGTAATVPLILEVVGWDVYKFLYYVAVAGNLIMIVGAWVLTVPNEAGADERRYGSARDFVRVALVFALINQFVDHVAIPRGMVPSLWFRIGVELITGLMAVGGQVVLLIYLRGLALRFARPGLAGLASFLAPTLGLAYTAHVFLYYSVYLARRPAHGHAGVNFLPDPAALYLADLRANQCLISLNVVYLVLLICLARAFLDEASSGRCRSAAAAEGGTRLN